MFLAASIKLVAIFSFVLGIGNAVAYAIFLLTVPDPDAPSYAMLTYGILLAQLPVCAVGVGLYRMSRIAWLSYWPAGLVSLGLAAEQARRFMTATEEVASIPFFVAVASGLWFLSCGICLLLPSSRQYYFNEPDPIWMHKRAVRAGRKRSTGISGRPRKPVGVSVLAWVALGVAVYLFAQAMSKFAEPSSGFDPQSESDTGAWLKVLGSVAIAVSAAGLFRTQLWGWVGTFVCAVVGIMASTYLTFLKPAAAPDTQPMVRISWYLLMLVWCGSAIICLLLPKVRRPFFSRHRSHREP